MGYQTHSSGITYQGIACDPPLLLVRLGESAIDDQKFPSTFDGGFAMDLFHRYMPVDNMGIGLIQSEFLQDLPDDFLIFQQLVVTVLLFCMSLLIFQEIPLKCCHLGLAEHRGSGTRPDVPDHILSQGTFPGILGIVTSSGIILQNVIQCFPAIFFSADLHLHETSVRI